MFAGQKHSSLVVHKTRARPLPRLGSLSAEDLSSFLSIEDLGSNDRTASIIAPHTTKLIPLFGVIDEAQSVRESVYSRGGDVTIYETGSDATDKKITEAIMSNSGMIYFSGHGCILNGS